MKVPSILEKFNVNPRKNASCLCFQLTRNVHFKWNICNFKFNFLSRGQLESLNLDRIFLPLSKILPSYEGFFFGNLIFAIIARILCRNHLNLWQKKVLQDTYFLHTVSLVTELNLLSLKGGWAGKYLAPGHNTQWRLCNNKEANIFLPDLTRSNALVNVSWRMSWIACYTYTKTIHLLTRAGPDRGFVEQLHVMLSCLNLMSAIVEAF